MEKRICSKIHRINYLNAELNALYHHASLKLGLTDSAAMVLYTIYDNGENCLLSDIYKQSGVSKQTVNSAIRKLEKRTHYLFGATLRQNEKSCSYRYRKRICAKDSSQII